MTETEFQWRSSHQYRAAITGIKAITAWLLHNDVISYKYPIEVNDL